MADSKESRGGGMTQAEILEELKKLTIPERLRVVEVVLHLINEASRPMEARNLIRRVFEPALRWAGLRKVRFHDLRHSYVAMLIDQGENIKFIQRQVGHSSIRITMDLYGHLLPETEKQAAARLEERLFGKEESQDSLIGGQ
jgi:integrase